MYRCQIWAAYIERNITGWKTSSSFEMERYEPSSNNSASTNGVYLESDVK